MKSRLITYLEIILLHNNKQANKSINDISFDANQLVNHP